MYYGDAISTLKTKNPTTKKFFKMFPPPPFPRRLSPDTPAHLDPVDRKLGLTSQPHLTDRWI